MNRQTRTRSLAHPPVASILLLSALAVIACGPLDAALADDGSSAAFAAGCERLEACCEELGASIPGSALAGCLDAVAEGGAACGAALDSLEGQGRCQVTSARSASSHPSSRAASRALDAGVDASGASASSVGGADTSDAASSSSQGSVLATPSTVSSTSVSSTSGSSSGVASTTVASSSASSSTLPSTTVASSSVAPSQTASVAPSSTQSSSASSSVASTSTAPACANPPATIPAGFIAPVGIVGSGCSSGQASVIGDCVLGLDAGAGACSSAVNTDAGEPNACYDCLYTQIPATTTSPAQWGAYLQVGVVPSVGDVADEFLIDWGYNFGGCVTGASPSGRACGLDLMQLDACQFAVCLPLCAIPDPGAGQPVDAGALAALNVCLTAAESGACSAYTTAALSDCAPLQAAGASGIFDRCLALIDQDTGQPDAGAPTGASEAALIGLVCGGADAGF